MRLRRSSPHSRRPLMWTTTRPSCFPSAPPIRTHTPTLTLIPIHIHILIHILILILIRTHTPIHIPVRLIIPPAPRMVRRSIAAAADAAERG